MEITNEQWIAQALEVHTTISLKISRQFRLAEGNLKKKKTLKQALTLIDHLDFLLESFPEQETTYKKSYRVLFTVLDELGLHCWVVHALQRKFGSDCFFVRQENLFEDCSYRRDWF